MISPIDAGPLQDLSPQLQVTARNPIKRNPSDLSHRRFSLNFFHSKDTSEATVDLPLSSPIKGTGPHSLEPERRFSLNPSAFIPQQQPLSPSQKLPNTSFLSNDHIETLLPTVELVRNVSPIITNNNSNHSNNNFTNNTNNITSINNIPTTTRRSSFKKNRGSSAPLKKSSNRKDEWYDDFKTLDSEFHRFVSKTGVNKANVLRLALLPFLRQQRGEFVRYSSDDDGSKRVRIFQKWWVGILSTLRDRERPVSGMDRSAYLEAVSAIVARNEWLYVTGPMREVFQTLLLDTLKYVVAKLSIKAVPANFAAFSGKILAYAFFYAPDVAPVLLSLLPTLQTNIDRIVSVSFQQVASSHQYTDLASAASLIRTSFPAHLGSLIAQVELPGQNHPSPPASIPELYGPWARRWNCFNSDIFYSFLKHYYTIISKILPVELPWNAHLASPGLIIIHSFLLGTLDSVVRPVKPNYSITKYVIVVIDIPPFFFFLSLS